MADQTASVFGVPADSAKFYPREKGVNHEVIWRDGVYRIQRCK